MSAITVMLGDHEIEVPEQRIGRLTNRTADLFSDAFGALADFDSQADGANVGADLAKVGREKCYAALCLLMPKLEQRMPVWEFAGYGSAEAMEAGEYDEDKDRSPTWPQITRAFRTAKSVNEFDMFATIKNIAKELYDKADPTMVGKLLNLAMAEGVSRLSESSAAPSGESASTSSSTNGLTSPSLVG